MSRVEERKAKKAANKKRKPWKWAGYSVGLILLVIIGFFGYQAYGVVEGLDGLSDNGSKIPTQQFEEDETLKPEEWEGTERVNILLMGGDNRGLDENDQARSDSMLVASVDPVTKKAHIFSVLRDTYVPIEGHGEGRINTAMALGGPNLAMKTIGDLLGLNIQYYVYTDFEGFKSLVDAIGGIQNFEVEKNMNYVDNADGNRYDIHLKKGVQDLDGEHALMYVRFRHDAMSDFTRTERQRKLLSAVADKMKSGWTIFKMKDVLESVSPYIKTNLELSDMFKLAQLGLGTSIAGQAQVPPMDLIGDRKVSGASVLSVRDEDALLQFVQDELAKDVNAPAVTETDGTTGTDGTTTNTESTTSE
ncbi:LCP family protein required for cell wall assembly [Paenibacillus phyllosphaerae]|uniref:LCP family protein required for cell wall assembly n=1 Tax=Paenibacillus phyllosphaerae TaxID=274593 RepID=A0A7W5B195_9BACL|nr:LCP family protein [Paenibacillus phyllosphaerae]MBB3112594.1 LCP family protein required for cell wall assembly [Paenibacillus phyllosphaerae]